MIAHTPWRSAPDALRMFVAQMPESKLELIGGRLIAGNSLAASRAVLGVLLRALRPQAALPFASLEQWWQALAIAFDAPPLPATGAAWTRWTATVVATPMIVPAGPLVDWPHQHVYQCLVHALADATRIDAGFGITLRQSVMRLGDDAFQPDLQLIRRDRLHCLRPTYTDGPADLVIEVVLPGSATQDHHAKRQRYAAGGVPEYWVVDPTTRTVTLLRLDGATYAPQAPADDGSYRSQRVPGLVFQPTALWEACQDPDDDAALDAPIFVVDAAAAPTSSSLWRPDDANESWTWQASTLPVGLHPTPISFAEYLARCPEARFEWVAGTPHIGGWTGTRNTLGLLLQTFGLVEAVQQLHPRTWVAALITEQTAQQHDAGRRDFWWVQARRAAEVLHQRFGAGPLGIVGDLLEPTPLHFWSELTLVSAAQLEPQDEVYQALRDLGPAVPIVLRSLEHASPQQHEAIQHAHVQL